jgi:hypothetical protein
VDQPVGRITQLQLYPIRPIWSLGPGWAAVSGALAAGSFVLSSEILLKLLLVWLLADPVLGTLWGLSVGDRSASEQDGIWRRLLTARLPTTVPSLRFLPYTQPGSPGRRLAERLGRLHLWWQATFRAEVGREFAALVAALGLALLLGAVLGRNALMLVLLSIALSWLVGLSQKRDLVRDSMPQDANRPDIVTLWYALGQFGIPWLIGAVVMGRPSWAAIALGMCYTVTYFGLIQYGRKFRLIGSSQAVTALLLAGLRHPLASGATAILLIPQWGLHVRAASGSYLRGVQLFIILGMLIASLAIAT